jgi:hypothetical protein
MYLVAIGNSPIAIFIRQKEFNTETIMCCSAQAGMNMADT